MQNKQRTWFEIKDPNPEKRTYVDDSFLFSFEFKLNKDVIHHKRSVYTFLDLLGDLGGLMDALVGIMSCIVALYLNIIGCPMQEYLLKTLFLKNETNDSKI